MTNDNRVAILASFSTAQRRNVARFALYACTLAILFPIISVSDDLTSGRRFSANPLRHSKHPNHLPLTIADDSAYDAGSISILVLPDRGLCPARAVGQVDPPRFDAVDATAVIHALSRSPPSNFNT